mgnify:CR=1 FL=1
MMMQTQMEYREFIDTQDEIVDVLLSLLLVRFVQHIFLLQQQVQLQKYEN